MKYTNFKKLMQNERKKEKVLSNPKKYLLKKVSEYSKTYLQQLKYKLKKRYGN